MITTTHDAAPPPRAFKIPDLSLRPRRGPPLRTAPSFRPITVDGARCYAVGLAGRRGAGWEAIVDEERWDALRDVAGERWHLSAGPDLARSYVVTCTAAARAVARTTSSLAVVSRVIAATVGHDLDGKSVVHRNGFRMDLRAANLEILPKGVAGAYRPDSPLPVVVDGWA